MKNDQVCHEFWFFVKNLTKNDNFFKQSHWKIFRATHTPCGKIYDEIIFWYNNMWFSPFTKMRERGKEENFTHSRTIFQSMMKITREFALFTLYMKLTSRKILHERATKPRTSNYSPIRVYHSRARHTVNCFVQKNSCFIFLFSFKRNSRAHVCEGCLWSDYCKKWKNHLSF